VEEKILMDALCVQFINSEFRDFRGRWERDDLQKPGWLEQFLVSWGLWVEAPIDKDVIASFVALRTLLRRMIEALASGPIAEDDQLSFNAILGNVPLQRILVKDEEGYHLELLPLQRNWDWVQAEIAASFASLMTAQNRKRLKICANPHCRGAFYDDTKSRTQHYCTPAKCGNLWKARRFRARHK
jgi:predicted RNA-binding Zn ribbon-like protein